MPKTRWVIPIWLGATNQLETGRELLAMPVSAAVNLVDDFSEIGIVAARQFNVQKTYLRKVDPGHHGRLQEPIMVA